MERNCLFGKHRIAVHFCFQKFGTTDYRINVLINAIQLPKFSFHCSDYTLRCTFMDTFSLGAVQEMPSKAFLTVFTCIRVIAHMVWTYQLVVMCRENNPTFVALSAPFLNFKDDAGCQLVIKIVEMQNLRLEILQHQTQLLPRFRRINRLNRISQFGQLASTVKIHIRCISVHRIPYAAPLMLHPEILNFVPLAF